MTRWSVLLVAFTAGCESPPANYPSVNLFEEGLGDRMTLPSEFDTLWSYGLGDPAILSASDVEFLPGGDGDAIVLDIAGQQVHRIGPRGFLWSWGRQGQGPQELNNVRAMTVTSHGRVVLADSGNRRLVWLSPHGEWLQELPMAEPSGRPWETGPVSGIFAFKTEGYLISRHSVEEPWVLVAKDGDIESHVPVPWQGFAKMHPMQTQGLVAGGADDRWVFGFATGNGFFVFDRSVALGSYPYVQHVDFPSLVTSRQAGGVGISFAGGRPQRAARDLAIDGDTLHVLVGGRLLDRYSMTTGEYWGTVILPGRTTSIATSDSSLLVIEHSGIVPVLISLRAKEFK